MAKSDKKKSTTEAFVGLATSWMPQPLADFFATPLGSFVLLVGMPFLLATGVITINWSNGAPTVTFDRERAVVVGREVEQTVETRVEAEARLVVEKIRTEEQQRERQREPQQAMQPVMQPVMQPGMQPIMQPGQPMFQPGRQPPLLQGAAQPSQPAWR
jgi:hypothetical protein